MRGSSKHHNMMGKQRRKIRENSTGKANCNYRSVMTFMRLDFIYKKREAMQISEHSSDITRGL